MRSVILSTIGILASISLGYGLEAAASGAKDVQEARMTFEITMLDYYKIKNSLLLEGQERVLTARFALEAGDSGGEMNLGELSREKLDSTMMIVKNTSSVSYLEGNAETYKAQLEYSADGLVRSIVMDQGASRAALKNEVKKLEGEMLKEIQKDGNVALSATSDITDYKCTRVDNTTKMNCAATVEVVIYARVQN